MDKEITKTYTIRYKKDRTTVCSNTCEHLLNGYCRLFCVSLGKLRKDSKMYKRCDGCFVNYLGRITYYQGDKVKTLKEIIIAGLKEWGADGVCNPGLDCGCGIDDFEPCDSISLIECVPAKSTECVDCPDNGKCEYQSILGAERCYRRLSEEK